MASMVCSNKKDGFPMVEQKGWKAFCDFALCSFEIQTSPSKIIQNHPITMMITRCRPMGNDKRTPMATTFIDMLCLIV
jgi:hypothetical protein